MNAIHFAYAFGALMAPEMAKPFLGCRTNETDFNSTNETDFISNDTEINRCVQESRMDVLYPMVGAMAMAVAPLYLAFWVDDLRRLKVIKVNRDVNGEEKEENMSVSDSAATPPKSTGRNSPIVA
jgi:hypothetical protein